MGRGWRPGEERKACGGGGGLWRRGGLGRRGWPGEEGVAWGGGESLGRRGWPGEEGEAWGGLRSKGGSTYRLDGPHAKVIVVLLG